MNYDKNLEDKKPDRAILLDFATFKGKQKIKVHKIKKNFSSLKKKLDDINFEKKYFNKTSKQKEMIKKRLKR